MCHDQPLDWNALMMLYVQIVALMAIVIMRLAHVFAHMMYGATHGPENSVLNLIHVQITAVITAIVLITAGVVSVSLDTGAWTVLLIIVMKCMATSNQICHLCLLLLLIPVISCCAMCITLE